jgi:hypothetical protein
MRREPRASTATPSRATGSVRRCDARSGPRPREPTKRTCAAEAGCEHSARRVESRLTSALRGLQSTAAWSFCRNHLGQPIPIAPGRKPRGPSGGSRSLDRHTPWTPTRGQREPNSSHYTTCVTSNLAKIPAFPGGVKRLKGPKTSFIAAKCSTACIGMIQRRERSCAARPDAPGDPSGDVPPAPRQQFLVCGPARPYAVSPTACQRPHPKGFALCPLKTMSCRSSPR